ncbi:MAG: outer membrane protein transport protein [Hyphomicrobium zavarzinii]|uniref:OmpP1/FadL family transporter n=1 Tax=Hyphomicrobium TaxID=81 RepID=UPI00047E912D|nr:MULTISPECIES: outer membrane protein transport protein [Hyphomicrobium]MBL8846038.1 outer membrane protein transport protein [Hyphomicrobium zavarzinii]WBT37656.1 outer membrane protein transport protein [Hyphomicrobium sp. DMF-1]HML41607.1 outer membrane protein transport protein [Hyphomicrobium zavarzinii]
MSVSSSSPMKSALVVIAMGTALSSAASATEGYFQHGYGARHKALGGAGVADGRDSTSISLNPAGLVHSGNEFTAAVSAFSPRREFEGGSAPGFTPSGVVESDSNWFAIPNLAASYRLDGNPYFDVIGFSVYGSGGMNTDYPSVAGGAFSPGPGIFGFGSLGVDLQQALFSVALAKTIAPGVSIGVAPIIARQQIKLKGLDAFAGASSDPGAVSNRGYDVSWGGGVRAGLEWAVAPGIRFGVAGNSPIWTQEFNKYRGLFAEQGSFDIPASIQAGIAVDLTPNLTLLADYRHIWFGSVASVANPSTNPALLGTDEGRGFGWDDVDVVKFGVEWRSSPALTLRAGYAYATNPISSRDVQFNILAPAVVQHHITAGFEYKIDSAWSVELAGLYAPEETVSGAELVGFGNPAHTIDISMYQFEATFGVKYRFGGEEAPLK